MTFTEAGGIICETSFLGLLAAEGNDLESPTTMVKKRRKVRSLFSVDIHSVGQ